jgi:hypothetical protein
VDPIKSFFEVNNLPRGCATFHASMRILTTSIQTFLEVIMNRTQRSSLAIGVILVLVGVYFMLANVVPGFDQWLNITYSWPTIIMAVGAGLLVLGLIVGAPDMAVPAVIVAGIGGILYFQNVTGMWGSWAYMWTLIPGFSGIGMILAHLLGARDRYSIGSALDTVGTSLVCAHYCVLVNKSAIKLENRNEKIGIVLGKSAGIVRRCAAGNHLGSCGSQGMALFLAVGAGIGGCLVLAWAVSVKGFA